MTEILTTISTYDETAHLPFPTLNYIKEETGEDIILNQGDTLKANAFVRQVTKALWNIIKQSKIVDTREKLEYLIATNEEYRQAFIDSVCSFIYDIYTVGVDTFMNATKEMDLTQILSAKTRSSIEGSCLGVGRFSYIEFDYREGY